MEHKGVKLMSKPGKREVLTTLEWGLYERKWIKIDNGHCIGRAFVLRVLAMFRCSSTPSPFVPDSAHRCPYFISLYLLCKCSERCMAGYDSRDSNLRSQHLGKLRQED